jgi:DNA-binding protein HU-beta
MNTNEFIKTLAKRLEITQRETRELVRLLHETIAKNLEKHQSICLRGFGTFATRKTASRKSYNPAAKKYMILPPKIVPFFKPSDALKKRLSRRRRV